MKILTQLDFKHGVTMLDMLKEYGEVMPELPKATELPERVKLSMEHFAMLTPSLPAHKRIEYLDPLNEMMDEFEINRTWERACFFLAQTLHESGEFRWMQELASGKAYESRTDLGNTAAVDGDGPLYKGHGPLQVTGYLAHKLVGEFIMNNEKYRKIYLEMYDIFLDEIKINPILKNPTLLTVMPWAMMSAGWVWRDFKKLNPIADQGNFLKTTKRINGGINGHEDRKKYLSWAMKVLAEFDHLRVIESKAYIL